MSAWRRPVRARLAVVALALLCALAGWVLGRLVPAPGPHAPGYLEQLTDALELRPDQVAALDRVLDEEDRELDELLSRGLEGLREEAAERRARTERELLALLDDAQRARYDALVAAEAGR